MINKEQIKNIITNIFNYIENGEETFKGTRFIGHPGLYIIHNKEELTNKINKILVKDYYDKYDLFYIVNYLIKYMLDKYDSHTKISFNDDKYLPIDVKIIDDETYIIYSSFKYEKYKGKKIKKINGVPIEQIYKEIEQIVGYGTIEYLHSYQEAFITSYDRLRSLPSIKNDTSKFVFTFEDDTNIELQYGEYQDINYKELRKNYSYDIIDDDIIHITYNECKNMDQMNELINKLKIISKEQNIKNFIIDLRNNRGGDSAIIKPLIEFLSDKNIVTLINEKVFSSASMALINLVDIGSYVIGTDISTPLNHFGNVPGGYNIAPLDMTVKRSSSYWHYNDNLECVMYDKDTFDDYFKDKKYLLEPILLHPDKYSHLTIGDYINGTDKQLDDAIKHFKNKYMKNNIHN